MSLSTRYCLGFAFIDDNRVLLVRKTYGLYTNAVNGYGGKVEPTELAIDVMVREFREETGIETTREDWKHSAWMSSKNQSGEWLATIYWARLPKATPPTKSEAGVPIVQSVETLTYNKREYGTASEFAPMVRPLILHARDRMLYGEDIAPTLKIEYT